MTTSSLMTLTFDVGRQDDDGCPWVITLEKVEPRGTGLDGRCGCSGDDVPFGPRMCDACAVEHSIDQLGAEEWLLTTCDLPIATDPLPDRSYLPASVGRTVDRDGTLTLRGRMSWSGPSSAYDDDYEEVFVVDGSDFEPTESSRPPVGGGQP